MNQLYISVAKDFSATPGGRYAKDGKWSGEQFRKELIQPKLADTISERGKLIVDLDGTAGYATSFLEEAFGGLVRSMRQKVSAYLQIVTDNGLRKREVESYIADEEAKLT